MSDPSNEQCPPAVGCDCELSRRDMVTRSAIVAAGALITMGMPRRLLAALRPVAVTPAGRSGSVITYPIPVADGAQIDRANDVILARWHGSVIAFNLACPHQRAPLRWLAEDTRFECPKHHSRYTPDGSYISGRATRAMDRIAITRRGASVDVDLATVYQQPDQPAQWKAAQVDVTG